MPSLVSDGEVEITFEINEDQVQVSVARMRRSFNRAIIASIATALVCVVFTLIEVFLKGGPIFTWVFIAIGVAAFIFFLVLLCFVLGIYHDRNGDPHCKSENLQCCLKCCPKKFISCPPSAQLVRYHRSTSESQTISTDDKNFQCQAGPSGTSTRRDLRSVSESSPETWYHSRPSTSAEGPYSSPHMTATDIQESLPFDSVPIRSPALQSTFSELSEIPTETLKEVAPPGSFENMDNVASDKNAAREQQRNEPLPDVIVLVPNPMSSDSSRLDKVVSDKDDTCEKQKNDSPPIETAVENLTTADSFQILKDAGDVDATCEQQRIHYSTEAGFVTNPAASEFFYTVESASDKNATFERCFDSHPLETVSIANPSVVVDFFYAIEGVGNSDDPSEHQGDSHLVETGTVNPLATDSFHTVSICEPRRIDQCPIEIAAIANPAVSDSYDTAEGSSVTDSAREISTDSPLVETATDEDFDDTDFPRTV